MFGGFRMCIVGCLNGQIPPRKQVLYSLAAVPWPMGNSFFCLPFPCCPLSSQGASHLRYTSSSPLELFNLIYVLRETDWEKVSIKLTKSRAVCLQVCSTRQVFKAHAHISPIPNNSKHADLCVCI